MDAFEFETVGELADAIRNESDLAGPSLSEALVLVKRLGDELRAGLDARVTLARLWLLCPGIVDDWEEGEGK